MRGTKAVYSEATINMALRLKNVGDLYQHLMETMDDLDLDVLKESLCNLDTMWMESNKSSEKTMLRMNLRPEPKFGINSSNIPLDQLLTMSPSIRLECCYLIVSHHLVL